MLLLDDGTRSTKPMTAATKSVKASRPALVNWMLRAHLPVWHPQIFLDSVVKQVVPWRLVQQQAVRQQAVRQQAVRQQPVRRQSTRQQRSFLEAISSQLSALPPPAAKRLIPLPENL